MENGTNGEDIKMTEKRNQGFDRPSHTGEEKRSRAAVTRDEIEEAIEHTREKMDSTLEAIEEKLSPGELIDRAFDYLSGFRGGIASNPIPAALIGVGLAWLVASRSGSRAGSEMYSSESYPVKGKLEHAQEEVEHTIEKVRGKIGEMGESLRETTRELKHKIGYGEGGGEEYYEAARMQSERLKGRLSDMWNTQPMLMAAIGLGVGAAIGAILPESRYEQETIGGTREGLKEKVKEYGKEQVEKVEEVVRAAGEAAKEKARDKGLIRENIER
jgi:ElaB/YqjD/DUF883 family membrane-anchored ribosome-binding protein